ncbi:MAG: phage antirepressor KilAC domain-containing protein [Liquorilactobacillus nagelii]|uniref:phage antirepressor KilAC domain-containing protein n=1 Tax=Lactobacillaceae TaxID=33958 RepID=UPI0039E97EF5
MNQLITVKVENNQQLVSARELHKGLQIRRRFSAWVEQNFRDFEEGVDFTSVLGSTVVNNGARKPIQDYALTLDMAKQLSMMSHTELGKIYRKYFIELERKWNDPAEIVKRGYAILQNENNHLKIENSQLKPKAEYTDKMLANPGLETTSMIAKNYGMSTLRFNKLLHEQGIQYRLGGTWLLYSKYHNKGYAHVEPFEYSDSNGLKQVRNTMKWTQKGQKFLYDTLKANGILPVIETLQKA